MHRFCFLTLARAPPVPFLTISSPPLPSICTFIDPFIHSSPLVSSSQLPSLNPHLFSFTSHLWSFALPFLFLPHPVHFVLLLPSSLPLSLSHSALCLALSGWAAPRWLRVCVHSGACRASPPPGLTTRFCLSPLNSAAPPPLPSLPPLPSPHPSLFFTHSTQLLMPPWCRQHLPTPLTLLPPHLSLSFPPCRKHTALRFFSGAPSNSLCLNLYFSFTNHNWLLCNYVQSQFLHPN